MMPAASHFEYTIPSADKDLYKIAENYKELCKDGFEWHYISRVLIEAYEFLLQNKQLPRQEVKQKTLVILNHFIDITDTPYLPDEYTDSIFKSLLPSLVDALDQALSGLFTYLPSIESPKPTAKTLNVFVHDLKESFSDGLQLRDIPNALRSSINFMGSFPFLKKDEKCKCVIDILDDLIDSSHTGGPDFIVHPIIKRIVHPFIKDIFNKL